METSNTFANSGWEERFYTDQSKSPRHSTVAATNTFSGVITGEGIVRYAMLYFDDERGQFVGLQTLTGSVNGRQGSFTVREEGTWSGSSISGTLTVIEGSGTGDLAGITGTGEYSYTASEEPNCAYAFDYHFGES